MGFWDDLKNSLFGTDRNKVNYNAISSQAGSRKKDDNKKSTFVSRPGIKNMPSSLLKPKVDKINNGSLSNFPASLAAPGVKSAGPWKDGYVANKNRKSSSKSSASAAATAVVPETGSANYDVFDSALSNALTQLSAEYTPSEYEVPQIDVEQTLRNLFDPQYQAINNAETSTKERTADADAKVAAIYSALENTIRSEGQKNIDKNYKEARNQNNSDTKNATSSLSAEAAKQMKEQAALASQFGMGEALAQQDPSRAALNEGIADVTAMNTAQNNMLQTLENTDEQLNRDSADVAGYTGANHRTNMQQALTKALEDLSNRELDTKTREAEKRLSLEDQNRAAELQAQQMANQDYQAFQESQGNLMQQALEMQLKRAELAQEAELANASNSIEQYGIDAGLQKAIMDLQSGSSTNAGGSGATLYDPLTRTIAENPVGFSGNPAPAITGVAQNINALYGKYGDWDRALSEYIKKYPNSLDSHRIAQTYVRYNKYKN